MIGQTARMTQIHTRTGDPGDDVDWHDSIEGADIGSDVSIILEYRHAAGTGPRLHRHPYSETFIIRRGHARFTVDGVEIDAHGGQILVVPSNTPHKFVAVGPGPLVSTHIHANPRFITDWLE